MPRPAEEVGRGATLRGDGYRLTPLGADLVEALSPLNAWSRRWAEETGTGTAEDRAD